MSSQPKIWFITGASLGFGRAMTEVVLKAGDIAVATVRRPGSLADLEALYPSDKFLVVQLDVTKEDEIKSALAKVKEVFGRIDVVYNNAGYAMVGEFEAVPIEAGRDLFETNFWGALNVTRAALAFMRETNRPMGGRILQASSMYGVVADGAVGYYAASKFGMKPFVLRWVLCLSYGPAARTFPALEGLTEALAKELDPSWNIKVTLIEPGFFLTDAIRKKRYEVYAHPAYTNPAVEGIAARQIFSRDEPPPVTPGDPEKLCKAMYRVANMEDPPLRLLIGQDALKKAKVKLEHLIKEKEKYESWSDDMEVDVTVQK